MTLTKEHLDALRGYLKEFSAAPLDASHQESADVVNSHIPALVDAISDEELTVMTNDMWSYIMTGIISAPPQEEPTESAAIEPASSIILADS